MTSAATGAPDWQTFSTLHSAALYDANVIVPAAATVSLGEWDSSSYKAVHVSILGVANGGTFTIFSGETASNVPEDIAAQWVVRPETRIEATIPLPRTKLSISCTAQAGAAWDFTARVALTNVQGDKHHYHGASNVVAANNIAIGAGLAQVYYPSTLLPGPAHLWVFNATPANLLNFDILLRNPDGTTGLYVAQVRSAALEVHQDLILPTRLYQITVFNAGAAGTNYYFSLCSTGMQT